MRNRNKKKLYFILFIVIFIFNKYFCFNEYFNDLYSVV